MGLKNQPDSTWLSGAQKGEKKKKKKNQICRYFLVLYDMQFIKNWGHQWNEGQSDSIWVKLCFLKLNEMYVYIISLSNFNLQN